MRTTRYTSLYLGSVALALTACAHGTGTGSGDDIGDDGDLRIPAADDASEPPLFRPVPEACLDTDVSCDGVCVDSLSDADHCGGCGLSCSDGQSCNDGICNEHRWDRALWGRLWASAEDVAYSDEGIVVVGAFAGTMRIPGVCMPAVGPSDAYVAKLTTTGELAWFLPLAGSGTAGAYSVDIGPDGHIAVAGDFTGALSIGHHTTHAVGNDDAFVARLDREGALLWLHSYGDVADSATGGVQPESQTIRAVDFLDGGDLAVAGRYFDSLQIGDIACDDGIESELVVARLEGDSGAVRWAQCMPTIGDQTAEDVVAAGEQIFVVGSFTQKLSLAAGFEVAAASGLEGFIASYDGAGDVAWSHVWLGPGQDEATAVDLHEDSGVIVVAGSTPAETGAAGRDLFIALLEPTGLPFVTKRYGIWGDAMAPAIDVTYDQIVVAGSFRGAIDFGHGELRSTADSRDAFVARFDVQLNPVWSHRYGDHRDQDATGVASSAEGPAAIAGNFQGTIDLGSGPLQSVGDASGFVTMVGL